MPSMNRAQFDNPSVAGATNPSTYGHYHGPIPNPNPGYVPARQAAAAANGARPPTVTTAENGAAPNPGLELSGVNSGVCDVDVGGGEMCGITCSIQPALRRHMRNAHLGAICNPNRTNMSIQETRDGQNALKLWVRSGGWRNARYVIEPGTGPTGGLIDHYATAYKEIARNDANFRAIFGSLFYCTISSVYIRYMHLVSIVSYICHLLSYYLL